MRSCLPTPVRTWGVMLRLHRESRYIPRIFDTFRKLARDIQCKLCVQVDRPAPDVVCALSRQLRQLPSNIEAKVIEAQEPLVGAGERYMVALQRHYAELLAMGDIDAASLWDDDMWLRREGIREMRKHFKNFLFDRVEALSLFLWDHPEKFNRRFPPHLSAILFRVVPGDQFPTDIMCHCPRGVNFSDARALLSMPLINAGYLDKEIRDASFARCKRAGKLDQHSLALIKPPMLESVNEFITKQSGRD